MKRISIKKLSLALAISLAPNLCCTEKSKHQRDDSLADQIIRPSRSVAFDQKLVEAHLNEFIKEAHVFGSERQKELVDYMTEKLKEKGWFVAQQEFQAQVPNPIVLKSADQQQNIPETLTKKGVNLFTRINTATESDEACVILIGSHYDTKRLENSTYLGANDSGSSSAALFWILDAIKQISQEKSFRCDIAGVWFDGEEAYLSGWTDGENIHPYGQQDNTYGSRHFVSQLVDCQKSEKKCLADEWKAGTVEALILLDLIGSPNARLTKDQHSSPKLMSLAQRLDQLLYPDRDDSLFYSSRSLPIEDDHIAFLNAGIDAIDLVDFENLDHWHVPSDTIEQISWGSIEKISRLAIALAISIDSKMAP